MEEKNNLYKTDNKRGRQRISNIGFGSFICIILSLVWTIAFLILWIPILIDKNLYFFEFISNKDYHWEFFLFMQSIGFFSFGLFLNFCGSLFLVFASWNNSYLDKRKKLWGIISLLLGPIFLFSLSIFISKKNK